MHQRLDAVSEAQRGRFGLVFVFWAISLGWCLVDFWSSFWFMFGWCWAAIGNLFSTSEVPAASCRFAVMALIMLVVVVGVVACCLWPFAAL